jgi:hypothetical protein
MAMAAALVGCVCAAAGCSAVAAAGESGGTQQFVDDIAARLSSASSLAYTAVYALPNGGTGTIAAQPATGQTAYTYPTGMTLVTSADATVCPSSTPGRTSTCAAYTSVDAASPDIANGGLIRPESVVSMLSSAAQNRDAIIAEHDSTLAGTSATCVTVTAGEDSTEQYDTCVTADGLLASFRGTWDGAAVDMTMVSFTKTVSPDAFRLPAHAKVAPAASASS